MVLPQTETIKFTSTLHSVQGCRDSVLMTYQVIEKYHPRGLKRLLVLLIVNDPVFWLCYVITSHRTPWKPWFIISSCTLKVSRCLQEPHTALSKPPRWEGFRTYGFLLIGSFSTLLLLLPAVTNRAQFHHQQVIDYLKEHELLTDVPYGFRHSRSTGDILSLITEHINRALDRRGEARLVALVIGKKKGGNKCRADFVGYKPNFHTKCISAGNLFDNA